MKKTTFSKLTNKNGDVDKTRVFGFSVSLSIPKTNFRYLQN